MLVVAPNNSNAGGRAIVLLKQYRPYLEMIPSMRRSQDSLITIPLPLIRLRGSVAVTQAIEPLENELIRSIPSPQKCSARMNEIVFLVRIIASRSFALFKLSYLKHPDGTVVCTYP